MKSISSKCWVRGCRRRAAAGRSDRWCHGHCAKWEREGWMRAYNVAGQRGKATKALRAALVERFEAGGALGALGAEGADAALLTRLEELEAKATPIVYVPPDGSSLVPGMGYRVAIVVAGEDGYRLTGDWPYSGAVGETAPWFWGPKLEDALELARQHNERIGVSAKEAAVVIARSMGRGNPGAVGGPAPRET